MLVKVATGVVIATAKRKSPSTLVKEDFQVLQGLLLTWINFNPDMDK